jgi:hypothetical protein
VGADGPVRAAAGLEASTLYAAGSVSKDQRLEVYLVQKVRAPYRRCKSCESERWGFGWELAHAAVSRRPPISLPRIVARTHVYTYAAKV